MSSYIRRIKQGIEEVVLATLTDYTAVWVTTHIARRPISEATPPYAVIEMDRMAPDEETGIVTTSYTVAPAIYILKEQVFDGLEIADDLELLRDAFAALGMIRQDGEDVAEIRSIGSLEWGEELEPNQFFDSKNNAVRAGRLMLELYVGESLNG